MAFGAQCYAGVMPVGNDYAAVVRAFVALLDRTFGDRLLSVAVFGSVARGDARPGSDIDLVAVLRDGAGAAYRDVVPAVLALRAMEPYAAMARRGWYPGPYPIFWDESEIDDHIGILLEIHDAGEVIVDRTGALHAALARLERRIATAGIRKVGLPGGGYFWDMGAGWRSHQADVA